MVSFTKKSSAFTGQKKSSGGIPSIPSPPSYVKESAPITKSPISNKRIGGGGGGSRGGIKPIPSPPSYVKEAAPISKSQITGKEISAKAQQQQQEAVKQAEIKQKAEALQGVKQRETYNIVSEYQRPPDQLLSQRLAAQSDVLAYRSEFEKSPLKKQALGFGSFGLGAVGGVISPYEALLNPKRTFKGLISTAKQIYSDPFSVGYAAGQSLKLNPARVVGEQVGLLGSGGAVQQLTKKVRGTYIKARYQYVEPETLLSKQVLKEGKTFPMAKSVKESVQKFKQAKGKVLHAAPKPLKSSSIEARGDGAKLLEDPGLYVAPAGEGSPYFFRLGDDLIPEYDFSFLPKFKRPTLVEIKTKGIKRQPTNILKQEGFEPSAKYLESQAGKGYAFITKRSEAAYQKLPTGKGGTTTEIEAVIPVGTELGKGKVTGYTKYKGEIVPIKEYDIIGKTTKLKSSKQLKEVSKSSQSYLDVGKKRVPVGQQLTTKYSTSYLSREPSLYKISSGKKGSKPSSSKASSKPSSIGRSLPSTVSYPKVSTPSRKSGGSSSIVRYVPPPEKSYPKAPPTRRGGRSSSGGRSRSFARSYSGFYPPEIKTKLPQHKQAQPKKKTTKSKKKKYKKSPSYTFTLFGTLAPKVKYNPNLAKDVYSGVSARPLIKL